MWQNTKLTERLKLTYPIIQAPMAGGITTPTLISIICNCGGLGSLGAGYLSATDIKDAITQIRNLTKNSFSVNLFVPEPHNATHEQMQKACTAINKCSRDLDTYSMPVNSPYIPAFEEQVLMLLKEKVPVISFTFGIPDINIIKAFHANHSVVIATATTLLEAIALQESGVDAIVAQGCEAGGHRGSFLNSAEKSLVPIQDLVSQMIKRIKLPIIASGGIMNGQSIIDLLRTGAAAVQLGTAFLTCKEAGTPDAYKKLLLCQKKDNTRLTRAFSGKLARGIQNKFMQCMEKYEGCILDYPIQNTLTKTMREKAKKKNMSAYMSLWSGQAAYLTRDLDAKQLFLLLLREASYYSSYLQKNE